MGGLVEEVHQLELDRPFAVGRVVLAQLVHLGLEDVIVHFVVSQQALAYAHALDGMCHVDFAGLEQCHAAHVVVHLGEPLCVAQQELVHQGAVELRGQEVALDLGDILGETLTDHVLETCCQEQEQQVELAHRLIDEPAGVVSQREEVQAQVILVEGILIGRGGQGVAVGVAELVLGLADEVQRGESADELDEVGVVALSVLTRVIQVGLAPHLVAQVVDAVDVAVVGTGERVLVVV